ncbi:MAG: hypothetical protein AAB600_04420 [Patescibacteria group bacterium]
MDNTNNKTVVDDNKATFASPTGPVGLAQKELAPISSKVKSEISEIIEASEKAPSVPTEAREAGVETVIDEMSLTPEHKAVGIQHAKESMPVPNQPSGSASLLKIDEVKEGLRISPIYSGRWLAELGKKVLNRLGLWKEGK